MGLASHSVLDLTDELMSVVAPRPAGTWRTRPFDRRVRHHSRSEGVASSGPLRQAVRAHAVSAA